MVSKRNGFTAQEVIDLYGTDTQGRRYAETRFGFVRRMVLKSVCEVNGIALDNNTGLYRLVKDPSHRK